MGSPAQSNGIRGLAPQPSEDAPKWHVVQYCNVKQDRGTEQEQGSTSNKDKHLTTGTGRDWQSSMRQYCTLRTQSVPTIFT